MLIIAVTGGIATGKSSAAKLISDQLGCEFFSADAVVHGLFDLSDVRNELLEAFGSAVAKPNVGVDRQKLREIVFSSERDRQSLESILHPRVKQCWLERAALLKTSGCQFFISEIPLLFETDWDALCDRVIVVGCRKETQLDRLKRFRSLPPHIAEKIIATQAPLEEKMMRGTHVLWNDAGCLESLQAQSALVTDRLRQV